MKIILKGGGEHEVDGLELRMEAHDNGKHARYFFKAKNWR